MSKNSTHSHEACTVSIPRSEYIRKFQNKQITIENCFWNRLPLKYRIAFAQQSNNLQLKINFKPPYPLNVYFFGAFEKHLHTSHCSFVGGRGPREWVQEILLHRHRRQVRRSARGNTQPCALLYRVSALERAHSHEHIPQTLIVGPPYNGRGVSRRHSFVTECERVPPK